MKVQVQVFSYLREYLPPGTSSRGEVELELDDQATLRDLFTALGFERRLGSNIFNEKVENTFQVMVNQAAVENYNYSLSDGDRVVMFPPMAGG
jgi:molybdopterin converting factor small subunit